MFARLGEIVVKRRGIVLVLTLALIVVSVVFGSGVVDRLAGSGFDDPDSDSVATRAELDRRFDTGFADAAFLLTVTDATPGSDAIDRDDVVAAGLAFTEEIAAIEGTDDVVSYWSAGSPDAMRSLDGTRAVMLIRFPGDENNVAREDLSIRLTEEFTRAERGPLTVQIGGRDPVFEQLGERAAQDLALAESIAVPITLLLLLFVFRSVVAALLPVLVGIAAIVGALFVLFVVTEFADVSVFALNLVVALGLGLSIDYSLLIVSRFREERGRGHTVDDAVRITVQTAGRTVAFSGLTVAVSLAALLVFPLYFLRSFAYAGIGVIGFALLVSVVALPTVLCLLGDRVENWSFGRRAARRHGISVWRENAGRVVEHPWPYLVGGVVLLVALAIPFLGVEWGESDHRALPADDPIRSTTQLLTSEFPAAEANAFPVVALGGVTPGTVTGHAIALSSLPDVVRVDTATGSFVDGTAVVAGSADTEDRFLRDDAAWFNVVPAVEPIGPQAEALVGAARTMATPFDQVLVGGGTASLVDTKDAILDRLPLAAVLIFGTTYVLLFFVFGSLLVPLKAIVLNLLSLGATFGLIVLVFQEGHGAGLLGITPTGFTDISTPVLVFGIAFGLSMDYEVFLLSRIKEEYERSGDNDDAIVEGIDRTGPLISAAAILLTVTFLAFATSGLAFLKLFGLGLAVAVLVDAFIVRITVVPALMALAGRANWWAPRPLRRLHDRTRRSEAPIDLSDVLDLRPTDPPPIDLRERQPDSERESAPERVLVGEAAREPEHVAAPESELFRDFPIRR